MYLLIGMVIIVGISALILLHLQQKKSEFLRQSSVRHFLLAAYVNQARQKHAEITKQQPQQQYHDQLHTAV